MTLKQIDIKIQIGTLIFLSALFAWLLVQSAAFQSFPEELARGLTLDFVLTLPLLYFFLIRKRKEVPRLTIASVFVLGIVLASFILPESQQGLLSQIKLIAIPLVEVGVLSVIGYKSYHIIQTYRQRPEQQIDFFDAVKEACSTALPGRIGYLLATEISVVYYLFFVRKAATSELETFTYFRKSGVRSVVGAFIGLVFVETFLVHILVMRANETLAWVLTLLSLYTGMQMIAFLRSMPHRLIQIDRQSGMLKLRYGFFAQTDIPLHTIARIEETCRSLPDDKSILPFSPLGPLDSHNLVLHLKESRTLEGLYGTRKTYQALAIYVDDRDAFVRALEDGKTKSESLD
ncbi:MAG: hypothetical protein AAFV07_04225 [Bacteroidota bacterium]